MRPERITQQKAQAVWDAIANGIKVGKFSNHPGTLPAIDMAAIFKGRASMTCNEVLKEVLAILDESLA